MDRYRHVIEKVADRIYDDDQEMISGAEIVEIIKSTPLVDSNIPEPTFDFRQVYEALKDDAEMEKSIEFKGSMGSCSFQNGRGGEVTLLPSPYETTSCHL